MSIVLAYLKVATTFVHCRNVFVKRVIEHNEYVLFKCFFITYSFVTFRLIFVEADAIVIKK